MTLKTTPLPALTPAEREALELKLIRDEARGAYDEAIRLGACHDDAMDAAGEPLLSDTELRAAAGALEASASCRACGTLTPLTELARRLCPSCRKARAEAALDPTAIPCRSCAAPITGEATQLEARLSRGLCPACQAERLAEQRRKWDELKASYKGFGVDEAGELEPGFWIDWHLGPLWSSPEGSPVQLALCTPEINEQLSGRRSWLMACHDSEGDQLGEALTFESREEALKAWAALLACQTRP